MAAEAESFFRVDGGYAWVVVLASFGGSALSLGMAYSIGSTFLVPWLQDFGCGRAALAPAVSLVLFITFGGGVLWAFTIRALGGQRRASLLGGALIAAGCLLVPFAQGPGAVYALFSLPLACGTGLTFFTASTVVPPWFERRRGMAQGLSSAGSGVGVFVVAKTLNWLVEQHGWRQAARLCGAAYAVAFLAISACYVSPPERPAEAAAVDLEAPAEARGAEEAAGGSAGGAEAPGEPPFGQQDSGTASGTCSRPSAQSAGGTCSRSSTRSGLVDWSLLRDRRMQVLLAFATIQCTGFPLPYIFLADHIEQAGGSSDFATSMVSVLGLVSVFGRVVYPWLVDFGVDPLNLFRFVVLVMGLLDTFIWPFCTADGHFAAFVISQGVVVGAPMPLSVLLMTALFGRERYLDALGVYYFACGTGMFLSGVVGGVVFDTARSYPAVAATGGICMLVSVGVISCVRLVGPPAPEAAEKAAAAADAGVEARASTDGSAAEEPVSAEMVQVDLLKPGSTCRWWPGALCRPFSALAFGKAPAAAAVRA